MIYFVTLYYECDHVTRWKIQDFFGIPRGMTLNGEWPLVVTERGLETARKMENKGYFTIRKKFFHITQMEASENFIKCIAEYLQREGERDAAFAQKMAEHPEKNAEAVCNYILHEVSQSRQCGYADEEVFGMAKHFIDEDELTDPGTKNSVQRVVTNVHVELSEQDRAEAKRKAEKAYREELERKAAEKERARQEREEVERQKRIEKAKAKREQESKMQLDLFGEMA